MTTITISIPESMKEYIEREISRGSYGTVSEYFRSLVRENQRQKSQERLEELLLEGLQSEAREMTKEDWNDIRRQFRERQPKRLK